jgi:hypothetical protein
MSLVSKSSAWLVQKNGAASTDVPLHRPITRIGRAESNDVVVSGEQGATVSAYHAEIRRNGDQYRLYDRGSTNGTYLNGRLVTEAVVEPESVIRLGPYGPEFIFQVAQPADGDLDRTIQVRQLSSNGGAKPNGKSNGVHKPAGGDDHEALVAEALHEVRSARHRGEADQTAIILRKLLNAGVQRSSRRLKQIIVVLVAVLAVVVTYSWWSIADLQQQKSDIDAQIAEIESRLQEGGQDPGEIDQLIARLTLYQDRARSLQDNLFYQFTAEGRSRIFIQREIELLLAEFGATDSKPPAEFVDRVQEYIHRYQGPDRPNMERALGRARPQLDRMREVVEQNNLPGDLAYMALVESAFINGRTSRANAAGLWQFRPETAQHLGLVVSEELDERFDMEKSTHAAARYIRSLILEFGSGNSVMLALAAYNTGPTRVRRAVRKVKDPIKQRNFWYLYSTGALPRETRDYVPKIFAAIIIGRNPEEFEF